MKESNELPAMEREQSPEEIRSILEAALEQGRHVDLVVESLAGEPKPAHHKLRWGKHLHLRT